MLLPFIFVTLHMKGNMSFTAVPSKSHLNCTLEYFSSFHSFDSTDLCFTVLKVHH
uniref:Uncharacterized protein n=1 Tax=Anguilla anguilla TaxID=7936 RepID=A0A0E9WTY3_ANGAN